MTVFFFASINDKILPGQRHQELISTQQELEQKQSLSRFQASKNIINKLPAVNQVGSMAIEKWINRQ